MSSSFGTRKGSLNIWPVGVWLAMGQSASAGRDAVAEALSLLASVVPTPAAVVASGDAPSGAASMAARAARTGRKIVFMVGVILRRD